MKEKKIGVLGGSFDPVHYGHISLAQDALEQAGLDRVLMMPARIQPFKQDKKVTDRGHRLRMLELAVKGMKGIEITTVELDSDSVSYTYLSMEKLRKETKALQLYLITGTDTFLKLDIWKESRRLLCENGFIVGVRPGYKEQAVYEKKKEYEDKFGSEVLVINNRRLDISSTDIRQMASQGEDIKEMTPSAVAEYIASQSLYG